MRQFKDPMAYNRAFRRLMLCLEDMTDLDKLAHYERGLESDSALPYAKADVLMWRQQWQKLILWQMCTVSMLYCRSHPLSERSIRRM